MKHFENRTKYKRVQPQDLALHFSVLCLFLFAKFEKLYACCRMHQSTQSRKSSEVLSINSHRLICLLTDFVVTDALLCRKPLSEQLFLFVCVRVHACVWEVCSEGEEDWVCLSGVTEPGGVTPTAHQPQPSSDRSAYRNSHSPFNMFPVWPHSNCVTKRQKICRTDKNICFFIFISILFIYLFFTLCVCVPSALNSKAKCQVRFKTEFLICID